MTSALNSILRPLRMFLNALLPFTDPKTPLLQDLVHTVALCAVVYYLPRYWDQAGADTGRRLAAEREPGARNIVDIPGENIPRRVPVEDGDIDQDLEDDFEDDDVENEEEQDPAQFQDDAGPADQPGEPAAAGRAARTNVGPKKARSLARRDQRRAYHEFQRQEAELRRQREAEGAEEREEAVMEEKRRRAVVEMAVEERQRKEREERKKLEESEREREMFRREEVLRKVREGLEQRGCVDLDVVGAGAEKEWVRCLVRAGGILGERKTIDGKKEVRLLTANRWVVRVDENCMKQAFKQAIQGGTTVSYEDLAKLLEGIIRERASG